MSGTPSVELFLTQAMEHERGYDWLGAVDLCQKALGLVAETDFLKMGQIQERIGYAFYKAAMQAESVDQFRERMHKAVSDYERAKEFYGRLDEPRKTPRMFRCDAVVAYIDCWLAQEPSEKKRLVDECWQLTREALNAFEQAGDALDYASTYNELSSTINLIYAFEWNFIKREKTIREAVEYGERAITLLSGAADFHELARAYAETALYLGVCVWHFIPDMDEKEIYRKKAQNYWQKANELSEEIAWLVLLSVIVETPNWTIDEMLVNYEKAMGYAKKTRDRFLIGTALDVLAYASHWKSFVSEDPDKRVENGQRALQYAEEAKHQFSLIDFVSPRGGVLWTEAPYAEHYWSLASRETDLKEKRDLLEKAAKDGTVAIELARNTCYPDIILMMNSLLSKTLISLAQIETNLNNKKKLLEKALKHAEENIRIGEQLEPFSYWNRGVSWNALAIIKTELSTLEKDPEKMLKEAVSDKERSLQLCIKDIRYQEKRGELLLFAVLGAVQYSYGQLLEHLHEITKNNEHKRRAVESFEEAAESFRRLDMVSRIAECHWKAAQTYDALGDHLEAAENFDLASHNYKSASEKILQLKDFYQDHAVYMQAWSEIEKARHYHERQEYGSAKEHYENAATMHKSLKQWSYLASSYSAWAQVERAEDLSRREQSEEAIQAFEQAVNLFNETKTSIQQQLEKIENRDEKQMATDVVKASDPRREYCVGRIALEEARILDKKGDHYSSSQKYGSAAEIFEKIQVLESEQDKKEFQLIITLSHAWQKMTQAESEASPILYVEASKLFEEVKELSPNEQAKMLALGHSRFCRALEAGTKFADVGDAALHGAAVQHLESAAKYYVKAGFQNASEYATGTGLLLDAYLHMDNAKTESDPEKKARLYTMAEKVLQSSAGSFMKAEHPEKREQVLKLLEKVKKERELALSLSEVLHAPSIVSATTVFTTPTPTQENAVGLERFEHANIQANLIIRQKSLKVGENLALEIELVNAGKGPAVLIKLAELIPEGFELTEKPEIYRVENSYLNMKGKRLDPLKTEEVKIVLKPKVQGTFPLKPRIHYLDETGKYQAHEPEPVTITVKELGISGWIKGPEKTKSRD